VALADLAGTASAPRLPAHHANRPVDRVHHVGRCNLDVLCAVVLDRDAAAARASAACCGVDAHAISINAASAPAAPAMVRWNMDPPVHDYPPDNEFRAGLSSPPPPRRRVDDIGMRRKCTARLPRTPVRSNPAISGSNAAHVRVHCARGIIALRARLELPRSPRFPDSARSEG